VAILSAYTLGEDRAEAALSSVRQTSSGRRTGDELIHPHEEAVAPDHQKGEDGRHHDREEEEAAELILPRGCRTSVTDVVIVHLANGNRRVTGAVVLLREV